MLVQVPSESHDAPAPPSQAAVAVMANSDARPCRKRKADAVEALAVQVMEENKQDEQGGPSNRSGGVLANDETTKPWTWNVPPEKTRRAICVVCKRFWMSRACFGNIACLECGTGPLCTNHRLKGFAPLCKRCFKSAVPQCSWLWAGAPPGFWTVAKELQGELDLPPSAS